MNKKELLKRLETAESNIRKLTILSSEYNARIYSLQQKVIALRQLTRVMSIKGCDVKAAQSQCDRVMKNTRNAEFRGDELITSLAEEGPIVKLNHGVHEVYNAAGELQYSMALLSSFLKNGFKVPISLVEQEALI